MWGKKDHVKLQEYMVSLQVFLLVLGIELMASWVLNVDSTTELPTPLHLKNNLFIYSIEGCTQSLVHVRKIYEYMGG